MSNINLPLPIAHVNAPWRPETEITWELAVRYRRWGWSVLPLYRKRPAARRIGWKHHQSGQCGEDRLRGEWGRSPIVDGVGVVGFVSGVAVVDFDEADAYRRWAEADPETAARCPTVRTCWGYHVYHRPRVECWFRHEAGEYIADRRHYFVAALSLHDTGILYEWVGTAPAGPEAFPLLGPEDFGLRPPAPQRGDRKPPAPRPAYPPPQSPPREITEWRAVRLSVPTRQGERNHKLWELARRAKFAPGADPWAMFQSWWECAEGVVGTADEAVSRRDFGRMLKLVQRPHGEGFREAASAVVNGAFPERVGPYADLPTRKLAALCQALQAHAGPNKPFPLSGRLAAELCGFAGQRGASRRIRQLEPYGLRKAKGCTRTLAAEYLFVPPPEPPSPNTSCETTGETQTPCPVLTVVFRAGGWARGLRELAREAGVSVRQAASALAGAVADGKLTATKGSGRRPAVYGILGPAPFGAAG